MTQEQTKKCPFCAEEIKADAIVCRYCQRDLSGDLSGAVAVNKTSKKIKKHFINSTILFVSGCVLFFSGIISFFENRNDGMSMIRIMLGSVIGIVGMIWLLAVIIKNYWDRG
ncbi:MAG: hypothetical protein BWY51_00222 [Parcubacteria group bacterium ADurb.Bin316]|nr:MAG: hypothetical protein BWY51_00222 [Parcubacteria group bacterium ADurb.Bin316]HOZ55780.1 hypothetical protein [bacterium]